MLILLFQISNTFGKLDVPVATSIASSNVSQSSFKRPASPTELMSECNKRQRLIDDSRFKFELLPFPSSAREISSRGQLTPKIIIPQRQLSEPEQRPVGSSRDTERSKFHRCHSESHVSIMKALNVASDCKGDLTGDFTQALSLPVIQGGKHPDLKSINIHTMASLLKGEYNNKIGSYKILDCRYPYEFDGGHVITAENWHHPKMFYDYVNAQDVPPKIPSSDSLRQILIFHCEFSAERGPRAQRMLREIDRTINKDHYPALHFPEIYLLEGGYKAFYEVYPDLCTPLSYVKMLDERHAQDFKFFRAKAKTWTAENRQGKCSISRTSSKRLGL